MRILGIDLGSRAVKIALMKDEKIIWKKKLSTMTFYRDICDYDDGLVFNPQKLGLENIDLGISTGYGRNNTNIKNFKPINEIKAHVYGSVFQTGYRDFVLLDIGGQDVKIAKIEKGILTDLELNEKCAASCGRYLENMANVLELSVEELSRYSKDPLVLNSTCAVFSESELIGKIAEGISTEQLCASINYSLFQRIKPLTTKFQGKLLVVSGGVARNAAFVEFIGSEYEQTVILEDPEYNGAIGCCYYGKRLNKGV